MRWWQAGDAHVADLFWSARYQTALLLVDQAQATAAWARGSSFSGSCLWGETCCWAPAEIVGTLDVPPVLLICALEHSSHQWV